LGLAVARWLMRRMQVQRFLEVLVYALLVFTSGASVLALAGTRELAPAALVAAVLAGLNAQDWFRVTFPQEYSINSRELLFSRGGRALTVLAFFALAILGLTGRLTPQHGRKLGLGFSPELRALIDGMTVDLNDRLFTASSDLQDDLERGKISDTLRKLFANNEVALPEDVTLQTEQTGRSWLIRGKESGSDYRLIREGTRLVIFRDFARDESRRGFNFVPEQGDVMIWIGHRPFVDSRVRLYSGRGSETDLLDLHRRTRAALRLRTIVVGDKNQQRSLNVQVTNDTSEEVEISLPPGGDDLRARISKKDILTDNDSTPSLFPVLPSGLSRVWRETFDLHEITHVLPRLSGSPRPDYRSMFALSEYPSDWQLLRIGSTTAVFFLKTDATRTIQDYLKNHKLDFRAAAFRTVTDKLEPRAELAQPASPYARYLTPTRDIPIPSIERGRHYAHMLARRQALLPYQAALQEVPARLANKELVGDIDGVPAMTILADTAALAFLAIRSANEGLATDPNNGRGFEVLGTAYACLDDIETALRGGPANTPNARRRYFQAILAMNQALVIDPNNADVLRQRFQRYHRFNRLDLALDSLKRYDKLRRLPLDATDEQRARLRAWGRTWGAAQHQRKSTGTHLDGTKRPLVYSDTCTRARISRAIVEPPTVSPLPEDTKSAVRYPAVRAPPIACSTASASGPAPSACRSSIATDAMAPIGLAMSFPAMVGAEPWTGSNNPPRPPTLADGKSPRDPTTAPASSDRMSPNRLPDRTTSKCRGLVASSNAHESTYWCWSLTSG